MRFKIARKKLTAKERRERYAAFWQRIDGFSGYSNAIDALLAYMPDKELTEIVNARCGDDEDDE